MHWQLTRRNQLVYAILAALWIAVMVWQGIEHHSVRVSNSEEMIKSGREITSTLGLELRSQRRFGITSKERLELALRELIHDGPLDSIVVLSPTGEQLAAAGQPINVTPEVIQGPGVYWKPQSLILRNLVDLGFGEGPDRGDGQRVLHQPRRLPPAG
jgi:hypothetical protein